jgi:hypothetical protein
VRRRNDQRLIAVLRGLARQTGGNSEPRARAANLRFSLRATYLSVLLDFSQISVQQNIVHRLWMTVYRELEPALNEGKEREKEREQKASRRSVFASAMCRSPLLPHLHLSI